MSVCTIVCIINGADKLISDEEILTVIEILERSYDDGEPFVVKFFRNDLLIRYEKVSPP